MKRVGSSFSVIVRANLLQGAEAYVMMIKLYKKALQKRKKNPPKGSAVHQAKEMGVSLLTEELYRRLQELGPFDLKTSSWIATPDEIRSKGGALFCERRYDAVFTFHNGADSYYSVRGWRGYITL